MATRERIVDGLMAGGTSQVGWRLAVVGEESALAHRAVDALEREGLIVTVEAAGPDLSAIVAGGRRPTMLIVEAPAQEAMLEETLGWAQRHLPDVLKIVVLPEGPQYDAGQLLSLGADAVVLEPDLEMSLGPVARAAAAGQVSLPAPLRHALQRPALSHRERQILALAVAGLTNAQIARRFYIAESTVKTHLSSAFRRLGVHSRREAAALIFSSDGVLRRSVLASVRLADQAAARSEGT
ncbi:MAG TPA: LuxR C-terminal-related transcriptional regulator [Thermoleophilaceae bacterium]|nr:LuxR C-terminal-related transcriptional regulator [Thermoleophilaceae bacterium]